MDQHEEWKQAGTSRCLFGENSQIKEICEVVKRIARSNGPVLIRGASGTGKEILAAAIHHQSPREGKPFVTVNSGAIPGELFESELFGHLKGSFTGADRDRKGKFTEADTGTLFLDEIGDMPLLHQVKLLRVLQNGEVQSVGAAHPHRVDVRVIAATNRNLEEMVVAGRFREDLYFRLNLFPLVIPPLSERREDILPLAEQFVRTFAASQNMTVSPRFHPVAEQLLLEYSWPGNIRELENVVHYAVTFSEDGEILPVHLPDSVRMGRSPFAAKPDVPSVEEEILPLGEMERRYILAALQKLNGNRTRTARKLGISLRGLQGKLKEWNAG